MMKTISAKQLEELKNWILQPRFFALSNKGDYWIRRGLMSMTTWEKSGEDKYVSVSKELFLHLIDHYSR